MHLWGITGVLPGDACPGGKELMLDTSLPVMLDSDAQPQHRTGAGFTSPLQQLKRWGEDMARPVIPGQQVADVIPEKSETKEQVQGGPAHCLWVAFAWQHRGRGPGGGQCLTRLRRQKAEFGARILKAESWRGGGCTDRVLWRGGGCTECSGDPQRSPLGSQADPHMWGKDEYKAMGQTISGPLWNAHRARKRSHFHLQEQRPPNTQGTHWVESSEGGTLVVKLN